MSGNSRVTILAVLLLSGLGGPGCDDGVSGPPADVGAETSQKLLNHVTCGVDEDCASGNCLQVGDSRKACMQVCLEPGSAEECPASERCLPPGDAGQQSYCAPTCTAPGDANCLSRNPGLVGCLEGICADAG